MPLNVGDPAPQLTGTDVVNNKPWSLEEHADKLVLLAFSGITWCQPCQLEAPALQAVWEQLKGNPSFTMAIISGQFFLDETPSKLQTAIGTFGITFPVIPGNDSWPDYAIEAVPTLYGLGWDAEAGHYVVRGVHVGSLTHKEDILSFLEDCGLLLPSAAKLDIFEAVFMQVFGGVIFGGSGWGLTPGGKFVPIPSPEPIWHLGPAGREVLLGLAIAEVSSRFGDAEVRQQLRTAGIAATKAAVLRLEQRQARWARGTVSAEPAAWGRERVAAPVKSL